MQKLLFISFLLISNSIFATDMQMHKMQHGFILSEDDSFASHLVAKDHHSQQTNITGHLDIDSEVEHQFYLERKNQSHGKTYFLFQAQSLNLPGLKDGQTLEGHIIESSIGGYDPSNKIVSKATFFVDRVLLNLVNPFFVKK
ncbi:MAG: hypothetical protein HON90_13880 [Halobacteriovoraceae bacterium]|jgi:hypothetical protein|nr:hypothetical protein [Halobacteriovoraceae bacterium]